MLKILNSEVQFLDKAIIASGLPMREGVHEIPTAQPIDMARAKKLGKTRPGTGHAKYLRGIKVFMTIKAPSKFWNQWDTYNFAETVSSTSTMHRITKADLNEVLPDTIYPATVELLLRDIANYHQYVELGMKTKADKLFQEITDNIPKGFLYTRAVVVSYEQLKTMYLQRRNHKLVEWRRFCKEIEKLPHFMELIGRG